MKSPLGKCCQASCDEKRSPVSEGMCGLCVRKKKKAFFRDGVLLEFKICPRMDPGVLLEEDAVDVFIC